MRRYLVVHECLQDNWQLGGKLFDVVYTANTFHIMSQADVNAFFAGLSAVTTQQTCLIVYGPFKYDGKFTSESNREFDSTLRSGEWGSSIKEFNTINELARQQGFVLLEDKAMPANNQCLIWQKI